MPPCCTLTQLCTDTLTITTSLPDGLPVLRTGCDQPAVTSVSIYLQSSVCRTELLLQFLLLSGCKTTFRSSWCSITRHCKDHRKVAQQKLIPSSRKQALVFLCPVLFTPLWHFVLTIIHYFNSIKSFIEEGKKSL